MAQVSLGAVVRRSSFGMWEGARRGTRPMTLLFKRIALLLVVWPASSTPSTGVSTGMSIQEQMAWLANGVYKLRTPVAGWKLQTYVQLYSKLAKEKDNFALYWFESGKECALSIAGTDSAADMMDNFDGLAIDACGHKNVHSGYVGEVDDLLSSCEFHNDFLPFLQSSNCSNGIHIVGHSLGGGVASVLAACANNPAVPYGFRVDKLWTFGAPGVAKDPLTNSLAADGCFNGGRFWNQDFVTIDPIPGLSRGLNFVHPRIESTRMKQITNMGVPTGGYETVTTPCDSYISHERPNPTDGTPQPLLHLMSAYATRTNALFTPNNLAFPTNPPGAWINVTSNEPVCPNNFNYSAALVVALPRKGFTGWASSMASAALAILLAIVCAILFALEILERRKEPHYECNWRSMVNYAGYKLGDIIKDVPWAFRGVGMPPRGIQLLADGSALPVELVYQNHLEGFMAHATAEGACKYDCKKDANGEDKPLTEPVPIWKKQCCKRHPHRPPQRTVSFQFLIFTCALGISRFFAGVTVGILSTYDKDMGRQWGKANSAWMVPWLFAVVSGPVATQALVGIVLTFAKFHDWVVSLALGIGIFLAAGEAALVVTENMSNTWILTRLLSIVMLALCFIEIIIGMIRSRGCKEASRIMMLIGIFLHLVAYVIDYVISEAGGPLPFNLLLLLGMPFLFLGARWRVPARQSADMAIISRIFPCCSCGGRSSKIMDSNAGSDGPSKHFQPVNW
mmetsp:Transcript_58022/g.130782  ORF Transcript_58022/g.130782 Transcript_58022/m.130782 type:complete len:737 (+) Transcript_58022:22-2232(+)